MDMLRRIFFLSSVTHGQAYHSKDQVVVLGWNRILLRHEEESAHVDRKACLQEIRSRRAQARRVQGNEDQVSRRRALGAARSLIWDRLSRVLPWSDSGQG